MFITNTFKPLLIFVFFLITIMVEMNEWGEDGLQARLWNIRNFAQDLIFFVVEWKWYVKFIFLLSFQLFSAFSSKEIIFF